MREHVHTSHNVSLLLYHIVCPTKYRRVVIADEVNAALLSCWFDIGNRFEIVFVEIGTDRDHVHFLVQSVPILSPTQIVTTIKSITAREVFRASFPSESRCGAATFGLLVFATPSGLISIQSEPPRSIVPRSFGPSNSPPRSVKSGDDPKLMPQCPVVLRRARNVSSNTQ